MARIAIAQHPTAGEVTVLIVANGTATVLDVSALVTEVPYAELHDVIVHGETIDLFGEVQSVFGQSSAKDMVILFTGTPAWADAVEAAWSSCQR